MQIAYTIADSPVGRVLVGTTERGVCAVALGASDAELERALRADFPRATLDVARPKTQAWVESVLQRIRDPRRAGAAIPLDAHGTVFQWKVWKALQAIPAGRRRSYREIAAAIGRPTAARAVARACATNPVAIVIPCHRVVRENGELGGYRWGVERKRRLLEQEAE